MTALGSPIKSEALSFDNRPLAIVRDVLKTDFDRAVYLYELPKQRTWQAVSGGPYIADPGTVAVRGASLDRFRFWALATDDSETCNLRGYLWPAPYFQQSLGGKFSDRDRGQSLGQPWCNIALTFNGSVIVDEHPVTRESMSGRWYECSAITLTKVYHEELIKLGSDSTQSGQAAIITIGMGSATGGTFSLSYRGESIADQDYDVSLSDLEDALEVLPGIGAGNIAVSGTAGTSYVLTFSGDASNSEQDVTITDGTSGGTGMTKTHSQRGYGGSQQLVCDWLGDGLFHFEPDTGSADMSRLCIARRMVM